MSGPGHYAVGEHAVGHLARRDPAAVPPVRLRFATRGWTTLPEDDVPHEEIRPGLAPMRVTSAVPVGRSGVWGGVARQTLGTIEIANHGYDLDTLPDVYECEGKPIRLLVGPWRGDRQPPLTQDLIPVWAGVADSMAVGERTLTIRARDRLSALQRPLALSSYGGSGGVDGTPDMAGRSRPVAMGCCPNITATPVWPDKRLYQVSDAPVLSIARIRDMGVALPIRQVAVTLDELLAMEVEPGEAAVCPFAASFRLGAVPVGQVTCDVFGDGVDPNSIGETEWDDGGNFDEGGGWEEILDGRPYVDTAGGLLVHIMLNRAGLPAAWIDASQVEVLDQVQPGQMGLYVPSGAARSCEDAAGVIAETCGAVLTQDRRGLIYAQQIVVGRGGFLIDEPDILEIARIDHPYGRAIYRHTMLWGRNWTVQTPDQLAVSLTEAQRAEYGRDVRTSRFTDSQILARVVNARAPEPIEPLFIEQGPADAEVARRGQLYQFGRMSLQVVVKRHAWNMDKGHVVRIRHRRFGLSTGRWRLGRPMTIVGMEDELAARRVRLTLWG